MQSLKLLSIIFVLTTLTSCNSPYEYMIKGLKGQQFCLEKTTNKFDSTVQIGNGKIIFNKDQTFTITNDSLEFSNLTGEWDLCCKDSDFGNYVFKVEGLREWQQCTPNLLVLVNGEKFRMFFTTCK